MGETDGMAKSDPTRRWVMAGLAAGIAGAALTPDPAAWALGLGEAKAQGLIGETDNGYVAPVRDDPAARALADQVNARRRKRYEEIAAQRGVDVTAVEALAGKQLIDRAGAGEFVRVGGGWMRK